MLKSEQQINERKKLIAQISKCKIAMVELIGEGAYKNFRDKIRLVNNLNFFIMAIKALNKDLPVGVSLTSAIQEMEGGLFKDIELPSKAPALLVILEDELEEVKTNINNYLDVNPEFAKLHNEMIALAISERKLKVDANSLYGGATALSNFQPSYSKEAHEVLMQSTGKNEQVIGRLKRKPE